MLNSTDHEISTAHKTNIPTNKEVSCFKSQMLYLSYNSWHFNIYEQDKFEHEKSFITSRPGNINSRPVQKTLPLMA